MRLEDDHGFPLLASKTLPKQRTSTQLNPAKFPQNWNSYKADWKLYNYLNYKLEFAESHIQNEKKSTKEIKQVTKHKKMTVSS